jgi:two-component sensor histidine kinase
VPIGLDYPRCLLKTIIQEWRWEKEKAESFQPKSTADYAMALDVITHLSQMFTEPEVIRNILQLFNILFAPGELAYIPITQGITGEVVSDFSTLTGNDRKRLSEQAADLRDEYRWSESGKGFWVRVNCQQETCGILKVDRLAFPEYKEQYLNLTLTITRVCGLAIANARKYQQLLGQKKELEHTLEVLEEKETQLRTSLEEKDALLHEIHHRVKNNLMVIYGLLSIQGAALDNPGLSDILEQTRRRIRTMAMVHEYVYRSPDLNRVDFNVYAREIADSIWMSSNVQGVKTRLEMDTGNLSLSINQAIPCGLILSELISNAIKHAFIEEAGPSTPKHIEKGKEEKGKGKEEYEALPGLNKKDREERKITVLMKVTGDDTVELAVKDNGCGIPPGIDPASAASMGLRLVDMMARQLKGSTRVSRINGTEFKITFPFK